MASGLFGIMMLSLCGIVYLVVEAKIGKNETVVAAIVFFLMTFFGSSISLLVIALLVIALSV